MEERSSKRERDSLINELVQGKEMAKQLSNHLLSSSSHETNEFLVEKILSSYEKALAMLNHRGCVVEGETKTNVVDSPCSFTNTNGSPASEVVDYDIDHKPVFKKRKTMPRWTEQVKICSRSGLEGSLDDGYGWRKYGQKDIFGAKFPRGYYRCTHRNVQGCLATKQVQRSDEDPSINEVTYRGRHTCSQAKHSSKAFPSNMKLGVEENQFQKKKQEKVEQTPEGIFTLAETELKVKTEELETKEDVFPWFCFLSPSIVSQNDDRNMLPENHFMESFSPSFLSPSTSESNLFSLSNYGLCQNIQIWESNITEIVSATTSVTNSPIMDLDFFLQKGDFDTDFPLNLLEYFSS